jgi:hypothetical protein
MSRAPCPDCKQKYHILIRTAALYDKAAELDGKKPALYDFHKKKLQDNNMPPCYKVIALPDSDLATPADIDSPPECESLLPHCAKWALADDKEQAKAEQDRKTCVKQGKADKKPEMQRALKDDSETKFKADLENRTLQKNTISFMELQKQKEQLLKDMERVGMTVAVPGRRAKNGRQEINTKAEKTKAKSDLKSVSVQQKTNAKAYQPILAAVRSQKRRAVHG